VGYKEENPKKHIQTALDAGDYIVQQLIPLGLWSEQSTWLLPEEQRLVLKEWQTDFRCFITDEGLQGFLARFGGVPTNVGSGGGVQPVALLRSDMTPCAAVDTINQALFQLGYQAFAQIQDEINRKAIEMGFTYLLGDATKMEEIWRAGKLDDVVWVAEEEKELALDQPWRGSPALMVSDGLFSFGADLMDEEE